LFLNLNHQKLDVCSASGLSVSECYKLSKSLPADEKFAMISQIRRAASSVHFNIADGASRRSEVERRRFYEVSGGSIIEIDAAVDIASDLDYLKRIRFGKIRRINGKLFQDALCND